MARRTLQRMVCFILCIFSSSALYAGDLSYPGDCKNKSLRKVAKKNGCSLKKDGGHMKVFKNGQVITLIPHSVHEGGTCRGIIKIINKEC